MEFRIPDAAQYTLGLFDSTALGWTVPAPPAPVQEGELETEPSTAPPVRPGQRGTNYVLIGDRSLASSSSVRPASRSRFIRSSWVRRDPIAPM